MDFVVNVEIGMRIFIIDKENLTPDGRCKNINDIGISDIGSLGQIGQMNRVIVRDGNKFKIVKETCNEKIKNKVFDEKDIIKYLESNQ